MLLWNFRNSRIFGYKNFLGIIVGFIRAFDISLSWRRNKFVEEKSSNVSLIWERRNLGICFWKNSVARWIIWKRISKKKKKLDFSFPFSLSPSIKFLLYSPLNGTCIILLNSLIGLVEIFTNLFLISYQLTLITFNPFVHLFFLNIFLYLISVIHYALEFNINICPLNNGQ